ASFSATASPIPRGRSAMLSLDQLRWRLAEKGYRHRHVERLLRDVEGAAVPPEVLDQVERFLTADAERIFRVWVWSARLQAALQLGDCRMRPRRPPLHSGLRA